MKKYRLIKARVSQSQGIHNQSQQPLSFYVVFGHVSEPSPPTSCALPMFYPGMTTTTNRTLYWESDWQYPEDILSYSLI